MDKIEALLQEYGNSDLKGLRRFVKLLESTERMAEFEKRGREISSRHDISKISLDLLMAYCTVYSEELPCLIVDVLNRKEIGYTLEKILYLFDNSSNYTYLTKYLNYASQPEFVKMFFSS